MKIIQANFSTSSLDLTLFLPHILKTIGFFYLSTYFLFIELELAKFWLVLVYSQLVRLCEHPFLICDIPDVICKLDLVFCSQPNRKRAVKKVRLGRDLNPDFRGIIDRGFRFLMQVSISSKTIPHIGENNKDTIQWGDWLLWYISFGRHRSQTIEYIKALQDMYNWK